MFTVGQHCAISAVHLRAGKIALQDAAQGDQPVEVDAGAQPHGIEHEAQVFHYDIAASAGRKRAPAQAGKEASKRRTPQSSAASDVREARPRVS